MSRKPPVTRKGRTHKVEVGACTLYVTVNRDAKGSICEVFCKADEGQNGHADAICRQISLGLQGRGDLETTIRHLRHDRTPPNGGPGQPASIYDALGVVLERERDGEAWATGGGEG